MKRDLIQFILAFFVIACGGALEELAPKALGVGCPILMAATAYYALNRSPLTGVLFAVAAGAAEDSLCALPFALSIGFFVTLAGVLRGFRLPPVCAVPAFAGYQIWLWLWLGGELNGSVFSRVVVALPVGGVTLAAVYVMLLWFDGKAAVNE